MTSRLTSFPRRKLWTEMSERTLVQLPHLQQLKGLEWSVIDQGEGCSSDPAKSLRKTFRDVMLKEVSCSAAGNLHSHWRTMAVPLEVLHHLR